MAADWVNVQLSEKGRQLAGDGVLRLVDRAIFEFRAGEPQRVTRAGDWGLVLSQQYIDGEPLFEMVEEG